MSIKIAQVLYGKHTIKISNIMIELSFYLNRVTDDKILNISIGIFCSWRIVSGWLNLVCVCQLVGFIQFTYQLFYGKTPKSKCNLWFYDLLKLNFTVYFSTDLEKVNGIEIMQELPLFCVFCQRYAKLKFTHSFR